MNSMKIVTYKPWKISLTQAEAVRSFIVKRFQEVWGITRTDIELESIIEQYNYCLVTKNKVLGCIGFQDNIGRHACAESGHSQYIARLLRQHLQWHGANSEILAEVPVEKRGSLLACFQSGHRVRSLGTKRCINTQDIQVTLCGLSILPEEKERSRPEVVHGVKNLLNEWSEL